MSIKGNGRYTLRCYSGGDRRGSGPFSNTSVVFGKHTQLSVTLCRVSVCALGEGVGGHVGLAGAFM